MRLPSFLLASLALIATARGPLQAQHPDSAMIGSWTGSADITVPWTTQRQLVIAIDIQPDGAVVGTIGDAQLVGAHFFTESRVARALHLARRYAIEGGLSSSIIRHEGVRRDRVRMSLDWAPQRLTGELQTNGAYEGTAAELILTARVVLDRAEGAVALRARSSAVAASHAVARSLIP